VTCGICNPKGFREAWQASHHIESKSPRVWGYAVASSASAIAAQVRTLFFRGAEHVFADIPSGQVRNRPGFKALTDPVYLRSGDPLPVNPTLLHTVPKSVEMSLGRWTCEKHKATQC